MAINVNITLELFSVQAVGYITQDVIMPGSIPALIQASIAAVQYVVQCLALTTKAFVINNLSPLPQVGLVKQGVN
jgi:hypothetical protein